MLLKFKSTNYKSFKDELIFSLIPAPKQKGLDYSVIKMQADKNEYRGLCSSVIYGPNASGKTNIIGAMGTLKFIMLRGHIRNYADANETNFASSALELIPNNTNNTINTINTINPVEFSITFIEDGLHIEYALSVDLGGFLARTYKRKILSETLIINKNLIFTRSNKLEFGTLNTIQGFFVNALEQNIDSAIALAKNNLNEEELFLMNGFKTMFSFKLVTLISNWLENKFIVIYNANSMRLVQKFNNPNKKSAYVEKTLNEVARYFGINSNALGYIIDGENNEANLYSIFEGSDNREAILAEIFESYGTIRFVNMFPLVADVLCNGGTLVVDEFDASIHPKAIMSIVNIFHNDDININNAQLIFNTHNPIFLNANLFRRDEIKFVQRDGDYSIIYSLSDFKTVGKTGVRKNEDYMKNYFIDRYGAIQDIDFTPIFQSLLHSKEET